MRTYTFTLDERLVNQIILQFKSTEAMEKWLQQELELIIAHHANGAMQADTGFERQRLNSRIDELSRLVTGWDGLTAQTPTEKALSQASMLVDNLPENILRYCAIFPSNDASVYFQGKFPEGRLTAYLNGETMTYVLKAHHEIVDTKKTEVAVPVIQDLASAIAKHCIS